MTQEELSPAAFMDAEEPECTQSFSSTFSSTFDDDFYEECDDDWDDDD